ncbi:MATE family efflux transporter [Porticoccaceae bacterium]|nr:MATE family efflux transporter [Porticoccaceae bacterium]MDA8920510.1 MATE family efflux transporter [Porticoccaceae bacterium]MDB2319611.1 MATE family efflux transporter [Porticoccaceae bacterium]
MNTDLPLDNDALEGPIVPTFIRYMMPSLLGLIAMTSASLVDGMFIGNYEGVTALAAVNLIIPITTLLFGVSMMISIGGSVRGGKYLGEKNTPAASAIFSKTLMFMVVYGLIVIILGLMFEAEIFATLGANKTLFPVMSEYYRIIFPFLFFQFIVIQIYFFIRLDGFPNLAATGLAIGAVVNISLDYLFIAIYGWGLAGAALATGLSEVISLAVMLAYFFQPQRKIFFSLRQKNWREVFQAAYNGISEFINEVSGALIGFIFNWMLIQRAGVTGVAAITLVNYLLFIGFMAYFAISDSIQVIISQNYGARNPQRIRAFLRTAGIMIVGVSAGIISLLIAGSESLIGLFIDIERDSETLALALEFVAYVWPVFIFAGFTMLISGYLTAVHLPFQSALVASCRSLIMPAGLLVLFYMLLADYRFVAAISVAEAISFVIAVTLYLYHTPNSIIREQP